MSLFVDTSVFYAAADRGDRSNARAKEILGSGEPCATSDHILVECWLLMAHRLGWSAAERYWSAIRAGAASIELITLGDLEVAYATGQAFPDQDFSIADRTSFAVAERLGIHRIASFDTHFGIFRFGPNRSRAFEVVR